MNASTKRYVLTDETELACRMLEAAIQHKRPAGLTAEQALATQSAELQGEARRCAHAAVRYFEECIAKARAAPPAGAKL